jgi:hypothetical protein
MFTPALRRFLPVPEARVAGATVGAARLCARRSGRVAPPRRGLRQRRCAALRDRTALGDPVAPDDEIYVFRH